MDNLAQLKGRVDVPAGLSAEGQRAVRTAARTAVAGRRVAPKSSVDFTVALPFKLEVEGTVPDVGTVSPTTAIELMTASATAKNDTKAEPLFTTTVAPVPELKAAYDSILGEAELKNTLLDELVKMATYRERLRACKHLHNRRGAVLFAGAPGTGKTTLADGLADAFARLMRSTVALHHIKTTRLLDKFVGASSERIEATFDKVRELSESYQYSVVVIDEYDAIAGDRTNDQENPEVKRAVDEFILQFDRLNFCDHRTVVFACSNIAQFTDAAVLRRFDRIYTFRLPDQNARRAILEHKLTNLAKHMGMSLSIGPADMTALARATSGYSGSDIGRLAGTAMFTAMDNKWVLDKRCVDRALQDVKPAGKILGGRPK